MLSRRAVQAARLRAELRSQLGGHCARCPSTCNLQFHLKVGDGSAHHAMSSRDRTYFYVNAYQAGNLELVCPDCHLALTLAQGRARRVARLLQSIAGVSKVAAATGCSTPQILKL
jgi:hypothetical protein